MEELEGVESASSGRPQLWPEGTALRFGTHVSSAPERPPHIHFSWSDRPVPPAESTFFLVFFFFLKFNFYLFIYGCVGSLFLCKGFL